MNYTKWIEHFTRNKQNRLCRVVARASRPCDSDLPFAFIRRNTQARRLCHYGIASVELKLRQFASASNNTAKYKEHYELHQMD